MGYSPKELRWLGLAREQVAGTAVAPSIFIPFNDFSGIDVPAVIEDMGIRGTLAADTFGAYAATLQGNTSIGGLAFPDSLGLLLLALLGTDAVTGGVAGTETGAASPSTDIHSLTTPTFKISADGSAATSVTIATAGNTTGLLVASAMQTAIQALAGVFSAITVTFAGGVYVITSGTTGTGSKIRITAGASNDCSAALKIGAANGAVDADGTGIITHTMKSVTTTQPPTLTISPYDPTTPNMRQFAQHMVAEIGIKWAESAALEFTAKTNGKASVVGVTATPTISQTAPIMTWAFTASLNTVINANLTAFDLTMKRKITVKFPANNSQAPSAIIAGALNVTGKMTFEKSDDTELNLALNNTQGAIVLDSTANGTQAGIKITLTKAAFKNPQVSGKDLIEVDVDFEGLFNATDGGAASIVLCNNVYAY